MFFKKIKTQSGGGIWRAEHSENEGKLNQFVFKQTTIKQNACRYRDGRSHLSIAVLGLFLTEKNAKKEDKK